MKNDVNELLVALKKGKKLKSKNGDLFISTSIPTLKIIYKDGAEKYMDVDESYYFNDFVLPEDDSIDTIRVVGKSSYKAYTVDYIYFNPQCNRTLAKLTDGTTIDYPCNLTTLIWNEFEVVDYIPKKKVTLKEIHAVFGDDIEIVGQ